MVLNRRSKWVMVLLMLAIFYWPTYFLDLSVAVAQKTHYFLVLLFSCLAFSYVKPKLKLHIGIVFLVPLLIIYVLIFIQRIPTASFFEVGILIKFFIFSIFSSVMYMLFNSLYPKEKNIYEISRVFLVVFYFQIFFVFLQLIFGDNKFLAIWNHKEVETLWGLRPPGTFDWVYATCFFLTFFIIYFTYQVLLGLKVKRSVCMLVLSFLCILLSKSKVGYAATVISLMYLYFLLLGFSLKGKLQLFKVFLFLVLLLLTIVTYTEIDMSYVTNFLTMFLDGKLDASTGTRQKQALLALSQGQQYWYSGSPLAFDGVIIENGYLDYLFRYGLFGFVGYIFFLLTIYFHSFFVLRKTVLAFKRMLISIELLVFMMSVHITLFSMLIYTNSGTITDGYKASFWFFIMLVSCFWVDNICGKSNVVAKIKYSKL